VARTGPAAKRHTSCFADNFLESGLIDHGITLLEADAALFKRRNPCLGGAAPNFSSLEAMDAP